VQQVPELALVERHEAILSAAKPETVETVGTPLFFVTWMVLGGFWFIEIAGRGGFGSSLLVIASGVTALLLAYRPARHSIPGALVGISLLSFAQALLLRHGPGQVCTQLWNGHENCRYQPSPAPWAFAAILLFAGGIALQRHIRRRLREREHEAPAPDHHGQ
jgi:hypothetical protein